MTSYYDARRRLDSPDESLRAILASAQGQVDQFAKMREDWKWIKKLSLFL